MLVGLTLDDVMVADSVARGHGEVRAGSEDGDQSGYDVVEALGLSRSSADVVNDIVVERAYDRHAPGHAGEDNAGNDHDHEDNPGMLLALCRAMYVRPCIQDAAEHCVQHTRSWNAGK